MATPPPPPPSPVITNVATPPLSISPADVAKYVAEQFKSEIEHTRSWPTKIMAFYVAICLGVVAALVTLGGRSQAQVHLNDVEKQWAIGIIAGIATATLGMLVKNHLNYSKYRRVQIKFQTAHLKGSYDAVYGLPSDWFEKTTALGGVWRWCVRWLGIGYYILLVVLIACLSGIGIWKS